MNLLYRGAPPETALSEKALYHTSLDRVLQYICHDVNRRREFTDILSRPLTDAEDIYYRQAVLRDFEAEPELMSDLISLFERFSDLYSDHRAIVRDKLRFAGGEKESADSAKNILQSQALCLKRALLFLRSIHERLCAANLQSEGLENLKKELAIHLKEPEFSEILSLLSSFEGFKTSGALAMSVSFDREGKISLLELIEPGLVKITDPDLKRSAFSKLFSKNEAEYRCERVTPHANDGREAMLISGIRSLGALLRESADKIFEKYIGIHGDLRFYETAQNYILRISELELPLCYPTFGGETDIVSLYDLFLPFSLRTSRGVVPNDIKIGENCGGILLFGANGSGKTVFLRSFAAAQILAQSGLPIAAISARILPRTCILTQFSEGEKEFESGNDAGRFEQEVRELAAMVDSAPRGALVMLNETFQTTAYAEGAAGLAEILKYFARNGISYIAVTHLHDLNDHFAPDEAVRMRTEPGFKIV